ncbi:MAG: glycosyltransferase [Aureliella sp.]
MRIALTITELDVGGAEKCLTQLALWLKAGGHRVEVFSLGPPPPEGQDKFPRLLAAAEIQVHFGGFKGAHRAVPAIQWLRKSLREFSPEIVQSMLFHANLLTSFAIPADAKFFGGARVKQPERIRRKLQGWAAKKMEKLVCVSADVMRSSLQLEGVPAEKLCVIPNGVSVSTDCEVGDWSELGLPKGCRVILSIGRLAPQKGYRELIHHADDILRNNPAHHIVIIGQGPFEPELRDLAATTQHPTRIHIAGWHADIGKWLSACELFILPTHYEGMPNALLEAMAAGLPVVVNDVEGIREVLGTGNTTSSQVARRLCEDNGENLAKLTQQLIASDSLRQECGQANLQRVKEHFSTDDQFRKYLDLYRDAIADGKTQQSRQTRWN